MVIFIVIFISIFFMVIFQNNAQDVPEMVEILDMRTLWSGQMKNLLKFFIYLHLVKNKTEKD
jgi:hypothetical protein